MQDRTIWGTFLLLGGALTMTGAMSKSGLADWFGLADPGRGRRTELWAVLLLHDDRHAQTSASDALQCRGGGDAAPILFAMAPKVGLHPVAFTLLVADTDSFAYILRPDHGGGPRLWCRAFQHGDYAKAGWVSVLIAIAYGILVMAPWYAYMGIPIWDPSAPWPF